MAHLATHMLTGSFQSQLQQNTLIKEEVGHTPRCVPHGRQAGGAGSAMTVKYGSFRSYYTKAKVRQRLAGCGRF